MTARRPKTQKDQEALDKVREFLDSLPARRPTKHARRPVRDGELAHLAPADRRAELQRRYWSQPGGDAA